MTKVLVFEKDYPDAATYRGPAEVLHMKIGNVGFAPTTDQLEAAAIGAANQRQYKLLRIKIYFEETIPTRYIYYEIYGYPVVTTAVGIVAIATIIIAILAALGLTFWLISQAWQGIIWGPEGPGGIPWGGIVILSIVVLAGLILITQREVVTKGIRVVGKPIAKRVEAL